MRTLRYAVLLLATVLVGGARAHAVLAESSPAAGAVLSAPPEAVVLTFSEGVEVDFSLFRVARLDVDFDVTADDAGLRLNGLAAAIIGPYLDGEPGGDEEVAVEATAVAGSRSQVELRFASQPLPPGSYVVMWRVLSEDTHVIAGHLVFSVLASE